jgi:hypothetical protein
VRENYYKLGCPVAARRELAFGLELVNGSMLFACWCWITLFNNPEYTLERYAQAHFPTNRKLTVLSMWETSPGSTRLERLGYPYEHRPYQKWSADSSGMPDLLFTTWGEIRFIYDIEKYPARGKLLKEESGMDFSTLRTPRAARL